MISIQQVEIYLYLYLCIMSLYIYIYILQDALLAAGFPPPVSQGIFPVKFHRLSDCEDQLNLSQELLKLLPELFHVRVGLVLGNEQTGKNNALKEKKCMYIYIHNHVYIYIYIHNPLNLAILVTFLGFGILI